MSNKSNKSNTSNRSEVVDGTPKGDPEAHITFRTIKFQQELQYYNDLLFGLPPEVHGDRVKYELNAELQTAWQQLYGNISSAYSKNGSICPTDEPKMFSGAQAVKYYTERVTTAIEKAGGMADDSEEVDDEKMELELAEHRMAVREMKFGALMDIWAHFIGNTGDTRWTYKAYAERGGRSKRVESKDDLRKQLQQRRSELGNAHMTDSEVADVSGERA